MTKYFKSNNNKQKNLQISDFLSMRTVHSGIEVKKNSWENKIHILTNKKQDKK